MAKSTPFHAFDSYDGEEYPKHRLWSVTYEPWWQKVRLATSFKSNDLARASCAQLEAYIKLATQDKYDTTPYRLYRVSNLLNAIPLGQSDSMGFARIDREREDTIVAYRSHVKTWLKDIGKPTEWDWDLPRMRLQRMKQDPGEVDGLHHMRTMLWRNRGARSEPKPELRFFLEILEMVLVFG